MYHQIFIILFAFTALIDSFNGFLIRTVNINSFVGQVTRIVILVTMFFFMLKFQNWEKSKKNYLIIYLLVFLQLIYGFNSSFNSLFTNLMEVFKVIYVIIIIQAFINLYNKEKVSLLTLESIFKFSMFQFPLLIIIPKILGLGYPMYESTNTGFSGFFYAANDLNLVMLIMLVFSIDNLFESLKNKQLSKFYLLNTFMIIISLILIGSKSSLFLNGGIIIVYLSKTLIENKTVKNIKILFIIFLGGFASYFIINNFYSEDIQAAFERHSFFLEQSNGDFTSFILTNRNSFFDAAVHSHKSSDQMVLYTLIGKGRIEHMQATGQLLNLKSKDIEMDMFDTFFSYGILGVILIYSCFLKFLVLAIRNSKHNFKYAFSFMVLSIYSFFGGHVLFSALSGTYLALICCGLYAYNKEVKKESAGIIAYEQQNH